jgi:hypothetical protein
MRNPLEDNSRFTLTPFHKTMKPFAARYAGTCSLGTCEKDRVIGQGEACAFIDGFIMHLRCIRRVERGETAPWCDDCARYHEGQCE